MSPEQASLLWVARASRALVSASRGNDLPWGSQAASLSISAASRNAMRATPALNRTYRKQLTMPLRQLPFPFLSLRETTEVRAKV
jgi:hypothetical protein